MRTGNVDASLSLGTASVSKYILYSGSYLQYLLYTVISYFDIY